MAEAKFFPELAFALGDDVSFQAEDNTDVDVGVTTDNCVVIRINENLTGWETGGDASIRVPKEHWPEFLRRLNALKLE